MSEIGLGTRLGDYRVLALIGQGGMGTVYRAEHVESGDQVALKVLADALAGNSDFRRRFVREARYARELDHPNVVRVQEVGEQEGQMYMVMPEVHGTDLKTLITLEGPPAPGRTVAILTQIADALDALHGRGIIHRDIKPGNVIVASGDGPEPAGSAYLTDFGLGKDPSRDSGALTAIGEFVGTFEYVAPEQVLGQDFDHRVDLYSLGCVLFECLTGSPPFPYDDDVKLLDAHVEDPPPKVTGSRPDLPAGIDDVVARAMAKDPAERYASAMEMADAAGSALGDDGPAANAAGGQAPAGLRLVVTAGPGIGREIDVRDELVIGRQGSDDGKLAGDREISRRHARIWRGDTQFMLEDLGSTNGTLLGGKPVDTPRPLGEQDVIEVGGTTLLVSSLLHDPPPAAAADTPAPGEKTEARAAAPPDEPASVEPVSLRLEIDFDARRATVAIGENGQPLELVERDGRWTVEPSQ